MRSFRNNLNIVVFTCAIFGFQNWALAKVETTLGSLSIKSNPNLAAALPVTNNSEILISRSQYVLSYNKERRTPNWVAWKVESKDIGKTGRTNMFDVDPDLDKYLGTLTPKQHAVSSADYTGSCFDRGHQAPSADRSDAVENNQATFLMSNMIPQTPYLNRVIWEHLEQHTRNVIQTQNKKAYVIAGPIYDQNFGAIGPKSDIQVPSKDFKVVVFLDAKQTPADINAKSDMIAVIMPNTLENGTPHIVGTACIPFVADPNEDTSDWQKYQTTLADVEKQAGIHLFPKNN
ncbi:MAG: DNA/RNA non-specific endonuclease [Bdellovibrio sp.]|nr:DNA/RNA non-specific endonuclease [Bdellovibrio sp.]